MMKKMASMLLVLAMALGMSGTALAAGNEKAAEERAAAEEAEMLEFLAMDEENLSPEIIKKYYTITEKEFDALQAETNGNAVGAQMASVPDENINVTIRRMAAQATAISGPYSQIYSMSSEDLEIMLTSMKLGGVNSEIYAQNYNGQLCYLFSNGTKNVYVKASAFYSTIENGKTFPYDLAVSTNLTTYANMKDRTAICSTHVNCSNSGNSVYYWEVSQIANQVTSFSGLDQIVKSKIRHSVSFAVTPHQLTVYNINNLTTYQPNLVLDISNGGSNNAYFDSFYVKGAGTYIAKLNISTLINLGYNITQVYSANFSVATLEALLGDTITLSTSSQMLPYYYESEHMTVSNESKKVWTRSCGLKAPFRLGKADGYYELHAGLCNGSSTVKYKVTVQYNF